MYEINFIPENTKKKRNEKHFMIKTIIIVSLLLTILIIAFYAPYKISRSIRDTEKSLESKYLAFEGKKRVNEKNQKIYLQAIELINKQKHYNGECIKNIMQYLLPDIFVESISYDSYGLVLMGYSREYFGIVKFEEILNKSKAYKNIRITSIEFNPIASNYLYCINIVPME